MNDHYKYFDEDRLPLLVLAVVQPYEGLDHTFRYKFKPGRDFLPIAHQTAGHGCHQHYMYGTVLEPRPDIKGCMDVIDRHWLDSEAGCFSASLDQILEYRKQLIDFFGLDCNNCYMDFEEGIYPIDCTKRAIQTLSAEDIPENHDDLIHFKDGMDEFLGMINRWSLFILGSNCD